MKLSKRRGSLIAKLLLQMRETQPMSLQYLQVPLITLTLPSTVLLQCIIQIKLAMYGHACKTISQQNQVGQFFKTTSPHRSAVMMFIKVIWVIAIS